MRHMLARLDPRVAAIVTTSGGTAEPYRLDNLHRILPYYTRIAQRALYKLGGQVPAISRLVPRRGPSPLALAGLPAALNGLQLQPATMRSASLFKPDALDLFLKSAYAPSFRGVGLLGRIITVELALKETNSEL
jgi:hypothetical protein